MRLVYVSDAIYPYNKGGKEKRLFELTTHLAKMGHDVHIYTMHWWKTPEKERVEHGVTLHAISKYYPLYKGDVRSIKEGVFFGLACLKLFRVKFDVLDVDHMPFFPIFSAWFVCVIRNRKLYGTWHESLTTREWLHYMGKSGYIASAIEAASIRLPYGITAASTHTRELLAKNHRRTKRVGLIQSGVDLQAIKTIRPSTTKCDILYVGRLVRDKHLDKLLEAVHILSKQHTNVKCLIIGKGPEKHKLEKQAAHLNIQKYVDIIDPLEDSRDIYAHMLAAKVFVLPSTREGFGIVALEALACDLPVITINVPTNAARNLIIDGQNGSLVNLDEHAIAQSVVYWLSQAKRVSAQNELAEYDWQNLAARQLEFYQS